MDESQRKPEEALQPQLEKVLRHLREDGQARVLLIHTQAKRVAEQLMRAAPELAPVLSPLHQEVRFSNGARLRQGRPGQPEKLRGHRASMAAVEQGLGLEVLEAVRRTLFFRTQRMEAAGESPVLHLLE
jgi:hypothetical protein